jgi:hypothetical protein
MRRCGGGDRPVGPPQDGGVAEPHAGVGAPREEGAASRAGLADHLDAVRVEDITPVQSRCRPLGVDQRRFVRAGRVSLTGFVVPAGEVLAQGLGCAVEEFGAEVGPAFWCVVDEVCGQGVGVAGEPVLVCGEQQRQLMTGVAVPVDVRSGVAGGAGRAGDDRTSGQRIFLSWAGSAGGAARGRPRRGRSRRHGRPGLRGC